MSFLDTTLTPESGYTHVNYKQVYDTIAAELTADGNWTYIESVDFVSGANTIRSFVWRCNASGNDLPNDFFVIFTATFVTATGLYLTSAGTGLRIVLCEEYNTSTKVASKCAPVMSTSSITLASDRTHPTTWNLGAALPTAGTTAVAYAFIGPVTVTTAYRIIISVTKDVLFLASPVGPCQVYVGAIDTLLSSTDDPMPIVLGTNFLTYASFNTTAATYHCFSSTRHPLMTPGAITHAFGHTAASYHVGSGAAGFGSGPFADPARLTGAGVIGDPANTGFSLFLGGAVVSRACISTSGSTQTGSTRGGLRGFLKHVRSARLATHSFGDTFDVDGRPHVAFGTTDMGLWDTAA